MQDHHPQFEFSKITDNIYLGTNLCCLEKSHIQILLDLGVTAEINLEDNHQDSAPDVPIYLSLPTADKTAPSEDQLRAGVNLIDQMVKLNKKIYVHCQYGHGRSPTLIAAYFISQGKSVDQAVQLIKQARPEIHLEEAQSKALQDYYSNQNS